MHLYFYIFLQLAKKKQWIKYTLIKNTDRSICLPKLLILSINTIVKVVLKTKIIHKSDTQDILNKATLHKPMNHTKYPKLTFNLHSKTHSWPIYHPLIKVRLTKGQINY